MKSIKMWALVVLVVAENILSATASLARALNPFGGVLCAAYEQIHAQDVAALVAQDSEAQEKLWVKTVLQGSDQENIFADNMMGGPGSGKALIIQNDLKVVEGNTINIPTIAPLGGAGVQGSGARRGNEEQIRSTLFPVKIGRWWFGVAIKDTAKEETVIGSQFDQLVNAMLRKRAGRKKTEDCLMTMRGYAQSSNTVRPNFKPTREALKTADVVTTSVIRKAGLVLSGLGGTPMQLASGKAGDSVEQFLFLGTQYGLDPLNGDTNYLEALRHAAEKGQVNPMFKGDYTSWVGHGIYRWYLRDHDAFGPVGSAIQPRAFLGGAIAATVNNVTISGGGSAAAAGVVPAPQYFEDFSNALYTFSNGNTIAADVTTLRYLAIQNLTGVDAGKIGFYSYKVNTGAAITTFKRLRAAANTDAATTIGNVTWDVAPWLAAGDSAQFMGLTDAHPEGSLIVETNSYGVPFGYSVMLAEGALVGGHGRLRNRNAAGARVEELQDYGMDHGIGIEYVFGVAARERTDGKLPCFVLVEHTIPMDGWPTIA
jgi:hypothetical protein